jgi:S-formylglutathione hydrolase FrmB
MSESRVVIETFESELLKGNFLGDPFARRVAVYLPREYDVDLRRYPVVFMLVGFTGRGTMLLNEAAWEENIQERLDRLIAQRAIPPLIMVMPDCFTRYGGSQYINSAGTGRYEDYVVQELAPWTDARFRTRAERDWRAVMGKSSGGFGALTLAMRHPDLFGAVMCHSGDMYFEFCYGPDAISYLRAIGKFGGLEKFLAAFPNIRPRGSDFRNVLNVVAMASCYSPNTESPYGFDLPFDEHTGEWNKDVWARWKVWDPIARVNEYADALRSMRLLYVECGSRDEFNLQFGARTFCARLARAGVPYQYEEFEDGHLNAQYRYDASLSALGKIWGA